MAARLKVFLFLSIIVFVSCRKPAGTSWDVDLALPIADTKLRIGNVVSDTLLSADSTGELHLKMHREVASLLLDSLLNLPDTVISDTLEAPFTIALNPGQQITVFQPTELTFDIGGGVELVVADLRKGQLSVRFSNEISEPIDLIYRVPSATRNGQALEIRETVPPGAGSLVKSYDLSGYRLDLRGEKGSKYNTIVQTYTLGLNANANPITVGFGQGAILEMSYSDIVPQYVQGYFGQEPVEIVPDTAAFDFLTNLRADNFMLDDATMRFDVLNQLGADFLAALRDIKSLNAYNGQEVTLASARLARIPVNWPTRVGETVQASTTTLVFDKNNSNIVPFISNLPDRISYSGTVRINPPPAGDVVGHTNYAYYGSGIKIVADMDIPVRFRADRIILETSSATDFSKVKELDNFRGGQFVIEATNGFPFDAALQVYMEDEWGMVIDSLFSGPSLARRAMLDGQNRVVQPVQSVMYIPVSGSKVNNLKRCRTLAIRPTLIMPAGNISIYEDQEFGVKIRAEVLYNVGIRQK